HSTRTLAHLIRAEVDNRIAKEVSTTEDPKRSATADARQRRLRRRRAAPERTRMCRRSKRLLTTIAGVQALRRVGPPEVFPRSRVHHQPRATSHRLRARAVRAGRLRFPEVAHQSWPKSLRIRIRGLRLMVHGFQFQCHATD